MAKPRTRIDKMLERHYRYVGKKGKERKRRDEAARKRKRKR